MGSLNKVQLIGNICQDIEVRYTKSGKAVTSFPLATSEKYKDEEKTEFHRLVFWGKLAEIAGEYLSKGQQIYVEGKNQTREWEDKEGNKRQTTEVVCHIMTMLGKSSGSSQGASSSGGQSASADGGNTEDQDFSNEDIPFS